MDKTRITLRSDLKSICGFALRLKPWKVLITAGIVGGMIFFDRQIHDFIHTHLKTDLIIYWSSIITNLGNGVVDFLIACLMAIFSRRVAYVAGQSVILAGLATNFLKYIFGMPRPWSDLGPSFRLFGGVVGSQYTAMPSGHTATAFAVAHAVALRYPRLRVPVYLLAALVGISRIYVNAHWASNVVAGAIVGVWATNLVAERSHLFAEPTSEIHTPNPRPVDQRSKT